MLVDYTVEACGDRSGTIVGWNDDAVKWHGLKILFSRRNGDTKIIQLPVKCNMPAEGKLGTYNTVAHTWRLMKIVLLQYMYQLSCCRQCVH